MKFLFSVFFVIVFVSFLAATIINIPADQPTIQEGINVAVDGDTVLVQPGTYVENINYYNKNITVASLFLITQNAIWITVTIIDGDSIDSVVTFEDGEDSTAVLCGFTITNGYALEGGGIYCGWYSSPSLTNLEITDNAATRGGGLYCEIGSDPSLISSVIESNTATDYGGGISCYFSNSIISNCIITDNSATGGHFASAGGGIDCYESSPSLVNVTITGNSADYIGGGICCTNNSNLSLKNVTISGNSSGLYGGGICCRSGSNPFLENVVIIGNESSIKGGGVWCRTSNPIFVNVNISENLSDFFGGGISCTSNSNPSFINVTISENSANNGGGVFCEYDSHPDFLNCIMWNDSPQEIYFWGEDDPNSITISYSDIQGGYAGIVTNNNGTVDWLEGNIAEYPLFVGTGEHPYALSEDSPCIDAGIQDTTGLNLPPWDIIGNYRIWDGDGDGTAIIDMGAYEYGAPPYVDVDDNVIVQTSEIFLRQNYPNPFNPTTTISFSLTTEDPENSELSIYNIKGQLVKTLVNEFKPSGEYSVIWDGRDSDDKRVSSGIYFYKLIVNDKTEAVKKCLLLK